MTAPLDNIKKCLETICVFPTIYKTGSETPLDILRQSGYSDLFSQITEAKIIEHIDNKSDLVETWLRFTEDIRHTPAWGLKVLDSSKWTVFYYHNGMEKELAFDNKYEACAKMIKMTMEELRKH